MIGIACAFGEQRTSVGGDPSLFLWCVAFREHKDRPRLILFF
jgi:hypothetical protein